MIGALIMIAARQRRAVSVAGSKRLAALLQYFAGCPSAWALIEVMLMRRSAARRRFCSGRGRGSLINREAREFLLSQPAYSARARLPVERPAGAIVWFAKTRAARPSVPRRLF